MLSHHRSIVHFSITVVLSVASLLDSAAIGVEPPQAIAQIRETSNSYVEALNRGDPDAIASFWTPHGTFVDAYDGTHPARELARQEFSKEVVSRAERAVTEHQSTIRLITPDVAIEQGSNGPQQSGRQRGPGTGYIAIWVKTDDRWLLDYLKEISVPSSPQESPLDELS